MKNRLISGHITRVIILTIILFALLAGMTANVASQAAPPSAPPGSSHEQRVAQRKQERQIALDQRSQQRLINTCTSAQGKIRAAQQKTTQNLTNRSKTYQQIDGKLWVAIGKLKLAEKDTFNLEKQRITLAEKATAFQSTAQSYQQSLDDAVLINCKADPVGFKALVDTARLYHAQLRAQSVNIRNFLINDIKATLTAFATELQGKPATEEGS